MQRKKWTEDEEASILAGVKKHGKGKWADIKAEFFNKSQRSDIDIKDKFRNIEKKRQKT